MATNMKDYNKCVFRSECLNFGKSHCLECEDYVKNNAKSLVFVYGTLKRGKPNHGIIDCMSVNNFVSNGYINGTLYETSYFPILAIDQRPEGKIYGELWEVCADTEIRIDNLEGIGTGFYQKGVIDVTMNNGGKAQAIVYHMPTSKINTMNNITKINSGVWNQKREEILYV